MIQIIENGTIEVDTVEGKIWVNTDHCVLRIQGVKFQNTSDSFSFIDIKGDRGYIDKEVVEKNEDD